MSNETVNPATRSERETNPFAFFVGFLREPQQVGSVIPSSRFLERRIVEAADLDNARLVVELGPGTGGTTRTFLRELGPDSRLLTIEMSQEFVDLLNTTITDPRLINHQGSAENLDQILRDHNLKQPDAVISGIPFSTMPKEVGTRIIRSIRESLAPGGRFVAYQFRSDVATLARPILGEPDSKMEVRNIPPMRVYRWHRKTNGHGGHGLNGG